MALRTGILALILLASATISASAAGDNVVLLGVSKVSVPDKLPGLCDVSGTVGQIWQGTAFHAGQTILLKVPCRGDSPALIPAVAVMNGPNVYFQSATILKQSHLGLVNLDNSGALIWDNSEPSQRNFGPWGQAYGYRVVDGAAEPVH